MYKVIDFDCFRGKTFINLTGVFTSLEDAFICAEEIKDYCKMVYVVKVDEYHPGMYEVIKAYI